MAAQSDFKPRLAVTMGDPAGIGPEIIVKSFAEKKRFERCRAVVIGSISCLQLAAGQAGVDLSFKVIADIDELQNTSDSIQVIEPFKIVADKVRQGEVSADCGEAAVAFFEYAVNQAIKGDIHGIVTCPINKEAIHLAGMEGDLGHQEILARITGSQLTAIMLMTRGLKVSHLSTHKPLAEAISYVKTPVILDKLRLTADSMKSWGIEAPRIAVAALNPHAGEGGLLGSEEIEEIAPAVRQAKAQGLKVSGPFPADSIFYRAIAGEFDAVLALYHDQGHIAIKVHNFEDSITATMGIPFVRTSVDHGTAFDIAGKNKASANGLSRAIDAAVDMITGTLA